MTDVFRKSVGVVSKLNLLRMTGEKIPLQTEQKKVKLKKIRLA